jgi:hypothetical protein
MVDGYAEDCGPKKNIQLVRVDRRSRKERDAVVLIVAVDDCISYAQEVLIVSNTVFEA